MPFVALRFDAPAATAEAWSDALLAAGAASVDTADANAGTDRETPRYGEPDHPGGDIWALCRLTVLFAVDADVERSVRDAAAGLGLAPPGYTLEAVAEQDWVRLTRAQFSPMRITDGLWVVPSWCEPVDPRAINLELDPGLAFGTGSHPTTRLCLRWLAAHLGAGPVGARLRLRLGHPRHRRRQARGRQGDRDRRRSTGDRSESRQRRA